MPSWIDRTSFKIKIEDAELKELTDGNDSQYSRFGGRRPGRGDPSDQNFSLPDEWRKLTENFLPNEE
eukprot:scaffold248816_cov19-Tisochrysis_lutea.AAC.1